MMAGLTVAQRAEKESKLKAEQSESVTINAGSIPDTIKIFEVTTGTAASIETRASDAAVDSKENQRKLDLIAGLKQFGIDGDASKTSDELMKELIEAGASIKRTFSHTEEDKLKSEVANYKTDTNLTNDNFIARLIKLGVPKLYVTRQSDKNGKVQWYLFNDVDKELTDDMIWFRINNSGINPLKPQELFLKNKKF